MSRLLTSRAKRLSADAIGVQFERGPALPKDHENKHLIKEWVVILKR